MFPTKKRIAQQFPHLTNVLVNNARAVMDGSIHPSEFQSVQDWMKQCYNPPSLREMQLLALDEIIGGFGTESIFDGNAFPHLEYVNMGDTYAPTIVYNYATSRFYITDLEGIVKMSR